MNQYPFKKCLNPRRILNPYTRESVVVECGHCPACALRKSSLNALRVKLESLVHKYSMFITLTYNNVSLPRMLLKEYNRYLDDCGEVCDSYEKPRLIDITQRLGTQGTFLGHCLNSVFVRDSLSKKVELPSGILPHLSKRDAQLFIKRLRTKIERYFKKYGKEVPQVRYYLVGEYGPVHFRPHYHVLLWFESDELYKVIRQILHKSWEYGRIDCQKSQSYCSDYVAKYLNSTCSLPQVFKLPTTRPFAVHSSHLGEKVFEIAREEVYENEFESVIKRSLPISGTITDINMWRSLKTYYFPKPKGYATLNKQQCLFSFKTYVTIREWTKETRVSDQTRIILNNIISLYYHTDRYFINLPLSITDYFTKSSMFNPWNFEGKPFEEHLQDVYRRIYMELRISKHFHEFVCGSDLNKHSVMLDKIIEFWKQNDYCNLVNNMKLQEEFGDSDLFECEEDYQFFYDNIGFNTERYKISKAFKTFVMITHKNSENAVKHKILNDKNKFFENK